MLSRAAALLRPAAIVGLSRSERRGLRIVLLRLPLLLSRLLVLARLKAALPRLMRLLRPDDSADACLLAFLLDFFFSRFPFLNRNVMGRFPCRTITNACLKVILLTSSSSMYVKISPGLALHLAELFFDLRFFAAPTSPTITGASPRP